MKSCHLFKTGAWWKKWDSVRMEEMLPGCFVPWVSESSMFEKSFYRIIFDSVQRRELTLYFVGLLIVLEKSRIQFDLTYAFRV